jgi:hypothetical protein
VPVAKRKRKEKEKANMGKNKAPKIDTQTPPVDGLTLAPAPVHKKRGRTHLTEADKAHMQGRRTLPRF